MASGATSSGGVPGAIRVLEQLTQDVTVLGNARAALLATDRGFDAHESMTRVLLVVGGAAIEGAFNAIPREDELRGAFVKPKSTGKGPLNRERADDMIAVLAANALGEHEQAVREYFELKARRNAVVHADPKQLTAPELIGGSAQWDVTSAGIAGMARCLAHWVFKRYPEVWLSTDQSDRDALNTVGDLLTALSAAPPVVASLLDLAQPHAVARGVLAAAWSALRNGQVDASEQSEFVRKVLAAWSVLARDLPPPDDVRAAVAVLDEFPAATPLRGASLDVELGLFLQLPDAYTMQLVGADRVRFAALVGELHSVSARGSLMDASTPDGLAHAAVSMMFREVRPEPALRALRVAENCKRVLMNTTAMTTLRALTPEIGAAGQEVAVREARERVEAAHLAVARTYEVRERTRRLVSAAEARAETAAARGPTSST